MHSQARQAKPLQVWRKTGQSLLLHVIFSLMQTRVNHLTATTALKLFIRYHPPAQSRCQYHDLPSLVDSLQQLRGLSFAPLRLACLLRERHTLTLNWWLSLNQLTLDSLLFEDFTHSTPSIGSVTLQPWLSLTFPSSLSDPKPRTISRPTHKNLKRRKDIARIPSQQGTVG